jgi:hypothetical protein
MRSWRGSARSVLATLVGLSCAGSARAQLQVATTPGQPLAIAHAELAYAEGAGTPVTWLSLRVQRGPVAIVAALPADAAAGAGLDAWFSALELTASPNVILPRSASNCGQTGSFVHVAWPRSGGATPTELSVQTPEDAAAALEAQGLSVAGELPQADRYLIWSWPAAVDTEQTTRTLRIVGGARPLGLLPGVSFPLLVSSVTRGGIALPQERFNRELSVTFVADRRPASDYVDRVRDWLGSHTEPLLEARARTPLFDWAIYDDTVSLDSLVASYAKRAAKELPDLDADTCGDQLRALRDPDAPSATACGDATDASLALAAAGSELATLQRFVVAGFNGFAPAGAIEGGSPSPPIVRAQRLDDSACPIVEPPLPPTPVGGIARGDGQPPHGTTVVIEETVVVDDRRTEVSCGGSPQPEPEDSYSGSGSSDGCGSDTSSSSETESSDTCSGDSSSSRDDSGCASDSSSSSSSDDSGCASDSGSSSSSDDSGCASDSSTSSDSSESSCSGSSESSGYDGDTCTGAAAPGAERTQKASAGLSSRPGAHRPRRLKASLWSMAFVALVLPIRRRKRGQVRRG